MKVEPVVTPLCKNQDNYTEKPKRNEGANRETLIRGENAVT